MPSDEASLIEQINSASQEELQALDKVLKDLEAKAQAQQTNDTLSEYSAKLQDSISQQRELTERGQEIGPLPPIKDPVRRAKCKRDLKLWIVTYAQPALRDKKGRYLGFSPAQEDMLSILQKCILFGGKAARAVRRGGFKSTIVRLACIWAILNGHWMFAVLLAATDDNSEQHRDNLLKTLATLPVLLEDYPELIPLLLKLANPKRQLRLNGELITVSAKDERGCILFPEIPGVECSAARIAPYSIMSTDISGLAYVDQGRTVRPDGAILDDVQTPESAISHMQTSKREDKICSTVAGLSGTGFELTMIYVGTVRENNDLTMRLCDPKQHPDWDGKVYPVLICKPTSKQWGVYAQKLLEGDTWEARLANATAFFLEHEEELKVGGRVSWENDKAEGYVSCLQWCMTMSFISPNFFRTELQQEGAPPPSGTITLVIKDVVKRLSQVRRGLIPANASVVTAFTDSGNHVLWWMVCAWMKDFTGWIVDYGTWPDQKRATFYKEELPRPLELELPAAPWEHAFVNAHNKLDAILLGREWPTDRGGTRGIDRLLKDWGDGDHTEILKYQIASSPYRDRIRPSKGFAPKPGRKQVASRADSKVDNSGDGWVEYMQSQPRHIQFDTNIWKGHMLRRLLAPVGAPSSLVLPGDEEFELSLLAEHLTSEMATRIILGEDEGTIFEKLPGRDNDWLDCLVGNMVAAAGLGCIITGQSIKIASPRQSVEVPPWMLGGGRT